MILGSAGLILVQKATAYGVASFGGLIVPLRDEWWRYLTAPFAYTDLGYLFVVAVALAIFGIGLEKRLGSFATGLLMVACGSLGMLAATAIVNAQDGFEVMAGGNGLALGVLAAWFAIRRAEARLAIDQEYDRVGVAVVAVVLLALPIFESTANPYAGHRRRPGRRPRRPARRRRAHLRNNAGAAMALDDERLEAAIERLTDSERFAEAERIVSRAAPQLQRVLAAALAEGGWFGESHQAETLKAATVPDPDERIAAVRALLAEEARMAMMVGVAVGWALHEELTEPPDSEGED